MSASDRELENMAKANRMRNAELASALRVIAKTQDDDALDKWVLGVAAARLEKKEKSEDKSGHMPFGAYMAWQKRQERLRNETQVPDAEH